MSAASWSVRTRLLLLVLSVWLPAVVALALLAHTTYRREESAARRAVQEGAEAVNAAVEAELDKHAILARTLAASVALRDGDVARFHQEAASATGDGAWVVLVDRRQQLSNTLLAQPQTLGRIPEAPFVEAGPPLVQFTHGGPVAQAPTLALYAPEAHVAPPRYNVAVSLRPHGIQQVLQRSASTRDGPATMSVVDRQQFVIARSREPERWLGVQATGVVKDRLLRGQSGFGTSVTLDGVSSLSYISRANRYGWSVVAALPMATLNGAARRLTLQATLASGALLLIGLALAAFASRGISRPLRELREAAVGLGRNEVPGTARTGLAEVDDVRVALHDAGARLEASSRDLQLRVAEAVAQAEQAQLRLLDAQKHEAIGRLTGGIAHDFNNLLQTISTGLQVVQRSVPEGRHSRAVAGAMGACARAADLVRQMLTFGRTQPLQPQPVQLRDFLLRNHELTTKAVGERIRLAVDVAPGVRSVRVDPTQLELALLNLIFNARDAMPGGGAITVRARLEGERHACIEVQDDGPGIPAELQAKVFDPYFTTKPPGVGSGLGLAQVKAFALQSGGEVQLASTPGQGTCVRLLLPACDEAPPARSPDDGEIPVQPLRVLMVEDDALVVSVVAPALQEAGHAVVSRTRADEARTLLQEGAPFDVLFTDVVMPGATSGLELAAWCRAHRPDVGVVVTTGYTSEPIDPGLRVLRKPYTMGDLLAALQEQAAAARRAG